MCIGIMMLMTGTLLWKYPESTMKITLSTSANKLTLLIREAQIRGSSVDSVNSTVGGYGIFIDSATSSAVVLFKDIVDGTIITPSGLGVGNGLYDQGVISEAKSVTTLSPRYAFKKLCVTSPLDPLRFVCDDAHVPQIKTLTVSFTRPSSRANIYINGATSTSFSSACIQVFSPKTPLDGHSSVLVPAAGHIRSIQVYQSGMVTTSVTSCDQ
jgi:hypothetical protein